MVNALLTLLIAPYPRRIENFRAVKNFRSKMFYFVNRLSN